MLKPSLCVEKMVNVKEAIRVATDFVNFNKKQAGH